jgi:hypothetical protein
MYFPSGYVLCTQRTISCLKSSRLMLAFTNSLAETGDRRPKSARPAFLWNHFFPPLYHSVRSTLCSTEVLIENHVFAIAEVLANLLLLLSCAELWTMTWRQAMAKGVCHPHPPTYTIPWTAAHRFLLIFPSQPPIVAAAGPQQAQAVHIDPFPHSV